MRIGWGFDAHRLGAEPPLVLGGVEVDRHVGVFATSDGDVLAHAVADALLGSVALGDLGTFFPSSDPVWQDADSLAMLATVVGLVAQRGYRPDALDTTVIAQDVRVAPHRDEIRRRLADVLGLPEDRVSVKATSTDHLGFVGRAEGVAATAVVTVAPTS